ncbi:hypothetical protein LR48_Vigan233s000700 [Vigna angularis]|uniref:Uncharacterized protein n=1 Tax=Phaseolus angularis TaxID=3914 RepID=A0A0L9T6C0_PHAAN|nr:hypothetical protein LR48_Vigan233s000700 [Vigna angularis]
MSPKSMLVLLIAFLLVTSSLAILPPSSPANNDAKPQPHTPKPPYHNKPSPHIENGHPKHHGKPPPHMEDASHKGKPSHIKDTSYDGRLPPDYNAKPPYQGGDPIHSDGKPPHTEPPHHGKPQPMGTTNRAGEASPSAHIHTDDHRKDKTDTHIQTTQWKVQGQEMGFVHLDRSLVEDERPHVKMLRLNVRSSTVFAIL